MPNTFLGKAQVSGSPMTLDVILYPIVESADLTQHWDEDTVLDSFGNDFSARGHNEKWEGDLGIALVDQSSSSTLANAEAGAVFLTPMSIINISASQSASFNGKYRLVPGSSLKLTNASYGKGAVKLRRYADSAQNTLMTTTPG